MKKDVNNISRLEEAKQLYIEQNKEEIHYNSFNNKFDNWWTAGYDPITGTITVYRSMSLNENELKKLINGSDLLSPAIHSHGSLDKLKEAINSLENKLKILEKGKNSEAINDFLYKNEPTIRCSKKLLDHYEKQEKGEDISEFVIDWGEHGALISDESGKSYHISVSFSSSKEFLINSFLWNNGYLITAKIPANQIYRNGNIKNGKFIGSMGEFEWTVLNPYGIKNEYIHEIFNIDKKEIVYKRK